MEIAQQRVSRSEQFNIEIASILSYDFICIESHFSDQGHVDSDMLPPLEEFLHVPTLTTLA